MGKKRKKKKNRATFLLFLLCFHRKKVALQFINAQMYCRLRPPPLPLMLSANVDDALPFGCRSVHKQHCLGRTQNN